MARRRRGHQRPSQSNWGGAIAAFLVGCAILIAISEIGLRIMLPHWDEFDTSRFMAPTSVPGYGIVYVGHPDFDGYFAQNNGDFRAHIVINGFGMRDPDPPDAADGRLWVVGDSMTFGWGVQRDETFGAVAAREFGVPMYLVASPGTDVCGYEALYARMPKTIRPKAVVLGLVLENDLEIYRCQRGGAAPAKLPGDAGDWSFIHIKHWLTGRSALYNAVAQSLKRAAVVDAWLKSLGLVAKEHAYHIDFSVDRAAEVVESTADEIVYLRSMLPEGTPFAVLVVPARFDIRDRDPFYTRVRESMDAALSQRGITAIDPAPELSAVGFNKVHFAHDGHWTPEGQHIAGSKIAQWLTSVLPKP